MRDLDGFWGWKAQEEEEAGRAEVESLSRISHYHGSRNLGSS
jgi:hypothetical protein